MMTRAYLAALSFVATAAASATARGDAPGHFVQLSAGLLATTGEDGEGNDTHTDFYGGGELRYDLLLGTSPSSTVIVGIDGGASEYIGSAHGRVGYAHRWITLTGAFGALIVAGGEEVQFDFRGNLRLFPRDVFYVELEGGNDFGAFVGREPMSLKFGTEGLETVGLEFGWVFPLGMLAGVEVKLPHGVAIGAQVFHQFVFEMTGATFNVSWTMAPSPG